MQAHFQQDQRVEIIYTSPLCWNNIHYERTSPSQQLYVLKVK